jgi:hypothetical protein
MNLRELIDDLEALNQRNKKDFGLIGENFNIYLRIKALIKKWRAYEPS